MSSIDQLDIIPEGVKALVFEGDRGGYKDFKHIEVILAALRALHKGKGGADILMGLFEMFPVEALRAGLTEDVLISCIDDPRKLAGVFRLFLDPVHIIDKDEL